MTPDPVREAALIAMVRAHWPDMPEPERDADRCFPFTAGEALDALQAAGYTIAPPGAVVVQLPAPAGRAVPDWEPDEEAPYWLLHSGDRLFEADADCLLYEDGTQDEDTTVREAMERDALERDALAMLAAARSFTATPAPESGGAG